MRVIFADQEFASKAALHQTIRTILTTTPPDTALTGRARELVVALLPYHDNANEKIGVGVRDIYVRTTLGSPGFIIRHVDDTEIDFSYRWCLARINNPGAKHHDVDKAFRNAIIAQKNAERDRAFADREYITCPITGALTPRTESVVHHDGPTFATLVDDFLAACGLGYDEVVVDPHAASCRLADVELERDWLTYHQTFARLVVVSKTGHAQLHARGQR